MKRKRNENDEEWRRTGERENNVESLASDCYCFPSPLKFNTVLIWTLPSQFVTNSLSLPCPSFLFLSLPCPSFLFLSLFPLISFVIFPSRRLEFWELHPSLSRTDHDTTDLIQWEQLFNGSSYFRTPTLSFSLSLSFIPSFSLSFFFSFFWQWLMAPRFNDEWVVLSLVLNLFNFFIRKIKINCFPSILDVLQMTDWLWTSLCQQQNNVFWLFECQWVNFSSTHPHYPSPFLSLTLFLHHSLPSWSGLLTLRKMIVRLIDLERRGREREREEKRSRGKSIKCEAYWSEAVGLDWTGYRVIFVWRNVNLILTLHHHRFPWLWSSQPYLLHTFPFLSSFVCLFLFHPVSLSFSLSLFIPPEKKGWKEYIVVIHTISDGTSRQTGRKRRWAIPGSEKRWSGQEKRLYHPPNSLSYHLSLLPSLSTFQAQFFLTIYRTKRHVRWMWHERWYIHTDFWEREREGLLLTWTISSPILLPIFFSLEVAGRLWSWKGLRTPVSVVLSNGRGGGRTKKMSGEKERSQLRAN